MQKEAINTWSDGLVSDLNPINTPNTVLTDCVNGTFITYNGNEHSLQNDMGNYRLQHADLPENYVPVGTAEYGDILYVVAYNPLDKHMQIGSFPSPQVYTSFESPESSKTIASILSQAVNDPDWTYEHLINTYQKMVVYYDAKGELKIYPGDQYELSNIETGLSCEKLRYYILDDNKKLHDITDEVKTDGEYHYVSWQVPGYLAAKWDLPIIDSVEIRPKTISPKLSGETQSIKISANVQVKSSDNLITKDNLKIYAISNNIEGTFGIDEIDTYDDETYYNAKEVTLENIPASKEATKVSLLVNPKIKASDSKYITYSDYTKEIDLTDIFSEDTCKLGNTLFVYQVHNYETDKAKMTLKFDLQNGVVSSTEIQLYVYYMKLSDYLSSGSWEKAIDGSVYDAPGTQIFTIDLPEKENVYVLKFELTNGVTTATFYRIVLCSELINQYSESDYKDFDKIPMDDWLKKALIGDLKFSTLNEPTLNTSNQYYYTGEPSSYWTDTSNDSLFKSKDYLDTTEEFRRGYNYLFNEVSCGTAVKYLYNFINTSGNLVIKDVGTIPFGETHTLDLPGHTYIQVDYKVTPLSDVQSINNITFTDLSTFCPENYIYYLNIDATGTSNLDMEFQQWEYKWHGRTLSKINKYTSQAIGNDSSNTIDWAELKDTISTMMVDQNAGCLLTCIHQAGTNLELFYSTDESGRGGGTTWGSKQPDYYLWGLTFMSNSGPMFIPFTKIQSTVEGESKDIYLKNVEDYTNYTEFRKRTTDFLEDIKLNLGNSPKIVGYFINEVLNNTTIKENVSIDLDCTTTITGSTGASKNLFLNYKDSNSIYKAISDTVPHEIFKLETALTSITENNTISQETTYNKPFDVSKWPYKQRVSSSEPQFDERGIDEIQDLSVIRTSAATEYMNSAEDRQTQYNNLSDSNGKGFYVTNSNKFDKEFNIIDSYLNHTISGQSFSTLRVRDASEFEMWFGCHRYGSDVHDVHRVFYSSNPDIIP